MILDAGYWVLDGMKFNQYLISSIRYLLIKNKKEI